MSYLTQKSHVTVRVHNTPWDRPSRGAAGTTATHTINCENCFACILSSLIQYSFLSFLPPRLEIFLEEFRALGTLSLQRTLCGWPSVPTQAHWSQPRCSSLKAIVWLWPHMERCQQNDFVSLLLFIYFFSPNKGLFELWVYVINVIISIIFWI